MRHCKSSAAIQHQCLITGRIRAGTKALRKPRRPARSAGQGGHSRHSCRGGPCCALSALHHSTALLDLEASLYSLTQYIDCVVAEQLTGVTPASYAVVLFAGLLTSLSPCTLSVLPLTIGYIGGYAASSPADGATSSSPNVTLQALSFSLGLASTLAALGLASASVGKAYGQIGNELPVAVSLVAIVMGLNLLEVVQLRLPSVDVDVRELPVPPAVQAYLAGATFALCASPCSTPILASLLAFVSTTSEPLQGAALLLSYTLGYVAPLLVAASFTGAATQLLSFRQYSAWITPASGALLVAGGTYTMLSRLFP